MMVAAHSLIGERPKTFPLSFLQGKSIVELEELLEQAIQAVQAAHELIALDEVRVHYLGKKGVLTERLKLLGQLSAEQRPKAGQAINVAKQELLQAIEKRRGEIH